MPDGRRWQTRAVDTPDVVRFQPRRVRIVCWVAAAALVVVFTVISTGLRGPTGSGTAVFEAGDQWAMIGLGLLGAAGVLLFTRPRVEADSSGIRVRNLVGAYDLPWEVVRKVKFAPGAPWVTLDLADDEVVAVMAVQAADKEYAVEAVTALRALLAAHQAAAANPARATTLTEATIPTDGA